MISPNFLVVGSPKCGTGAICNFLDQHPDIFLPGRREPNYFSTDLAHDDAATPEEYAALFAGRTEQMLGEGSTWYLYSRAAPARILETCGRDTRIIVIVRNPIELVASLFDYRRYYAAHEFTTIAAALRHEEAHLRAVQLGETLADPLVIHRAVARFDEGIARYVDTFGADRVKIVFYDDLVRDTRGLMHDLYGFLGVDDSFEFADRRVNQSFGRRFYWLARILRWRLGPVRKALAFLPRGLRRAMLRLVDRLNSRAAPPRALPFPIEADLMVYFHDDVRALERRTGRDLSHWISDRSLEVPIVQPGPRLTDTVVSL